MTGIQPRNCAVGQCASSFPYKDECGLVASGCCARNVLDTAKALDGARFPMDLRPGGNPFVKALEASGLVRVRHEITYAATPA